MRLVQTLHPSQRGEEGKKRSIKLHEEEKILDRNKAEELEYLTHGHYYATGEKSKQSGQPSEICTA